MKKVLGKIAGVIAICIFLYPIFKMTMSAMDREVNLYPILMVFLAVLIAILLSKKKN